MSDVLERQQRRELRGSILRMLETVCGRAPDTVGMKSLLRVIQGATERRLQLELQYLSDLQYIARVEHGRDALDREVSASWRLLPKGAQILNGDLKDESIEL